MPTPTSTVDAKARARYRARFQRSESAITAARASRVALIREMRDEAGMTFAAIGETLGRDPRLIRVQYHGGRRVPTDQSTGTGE